MITLAISLAIATSMLDVFLPRDTCAKYLEDPCKSFLARQIDYDECRNDAEFYKAGEK
jgi:hypothetical protein